MVLIKCKSLKSLHLALAIVCTILIKPFLSFHVFVLFPLLLTTGAQYIFLDLCLHLWCDIRDWFLCQPTGFLPLCQVQHTEKKPSGHPAAEHGPR